MMKKFLVVCLAILLASSVFGAEQESFSFVYLGDIHYGGPSFRPAKFVEEIAQDIKNKGYQVDFVCQTGDLIHAQEGSKAATVEDAGAQWKFALSHMKKTFNLPFFMSPGNHDWYGDDWFGGKKNIEQIFIPFISAELGRPLIRMPSYSFRWSNSYFLFLNHLGFDSGWDKEEIRWLKRTLTYAQKNPAVEHIFLFAHPHLWNLNYLGFNEHHPLRDIISQYRVDAYFAGHSHKNIASVYKFSRKSNLLQITGGPMGPKKLTSLSRTHLALNPPPSKRGYFRAYHGAHSYFIISVTGEKVTASLDIVGGERVWEFYWTKPGKIVEVKAPSEPAEYHLKPQDLGDIAEARLFLYAYTPEIVPSMGSNSQVPVLLNGVRIGSLPESYYWIISGNTYIEVPPELVRMENKIVIQNPHRQTFGVRDCYLYVKLKDGRESFSQLYPYVAFSIPDYRDLYLDFWLTHPTWGALNGSIEENVPKELAKTVEWGEDISFSLRFPEQSKP